MKIFKHLLYNLKFKRKRRKSILPPIFERSPSLFERHNVVPRQVLDPLVQLLYTQLRQGLVRDLGMSSINKFRRRSLKSLTVLHLQKTIFGSKKA